VNYICLHCVKPSLRPLSMAMSTVSIHIFGDVPSSPLVGVLQVHNTSFTLIFQLILSSLDVIFQKSDVLFSNLGCYQQLERDCTYIDFYSLHCCYYMVFW
jgi:hypothetical protein